MSTVALFLGIVGTTVFTYAVSTEKNQVTLLVDEVKANLIKYVYPLPYKLGDGNRFGTGFRAGRPDFPGVARISIDIKHKHWESLKIQRELSLKADKWVRYEDNYVPAIIRFEDESYKARIRFKGMAIDHIKEDKWSYRIIIKGKKTFFGMKQFSIQHPSQRNWLYEKIVHLAMKREGLLGLRYDFIYVTINGRDMGLYALEEHFEKRLVENNRRLNGPIVKFADAGFAEYDSAKSGVVRRDPVLYQQYQKATGLLVALGNGELSVGEVFDLEKLAKFAAIIDLLAAYHGFHWSSSRMYYNPVTSRLEIFGYDNLSSGHFEHLVGAGRSYFQAPGPYNRTFINRLFHDPEFFKAYVRALEQVTEKSYLDKLLADLKDVIERDEKLLQSEWVNFSFTKAWFFAPTMVSSVDFLYQTVEKIRAIISGQGMVEAHYQNRHDGKIALALKNSSPMPIEVMGVYFQDSLHEPLQSAVLPVNHPEDEAPARLVYFSESDFGETPISSLKLKYRVMGASLEQEASIHPTPIAEKTPLQSATGASFPGKNPSSPVPNNSSCVNLEDTIRETGKLDELDFIDVSEATREIVFRAGPWDENTKTYLPWELSRNLVLPEGYKVIVEPGSKIISHNCASILTYSPVTFTGKQNPLTIYFGSKDITREKSRLDEYDFLDVSEATKEIIIRTGTWKLSRNLVFPKGYQVIARPGAQIDLSNGAIILSYSQISLIGTEDNPVVIQSSGNNGGGLVVLNADGMSDLRHTIFKGLSAPESDGWKLTGTVTFYESDVRIENCQFLGNNSEDSLHVLRSKVNIADTHFKDAPSDAFDGDFVEARIERSQFLNSGNDAVDVSGSRLVMKDVLIDVAGDKGLSAGEKSQASIERIEIKSANIAIASKDMSIVTAEDISIEDSMIGFAVYQKKSEFGPAEIKTERVHSNTSITPFILEARSTLLMDGMAKTANQKKAYKALYPNNN